MSAKKMTPAERRLHWEEVYRSKPAVETSWYQAEPSTSLAMIRNTGARPDQGLIDVGGGASLLVDHLLKWDFRDITVLDLSAEAMEQARLRLGAKARHVRWVVADITEYAPDRHFAVWHDRAAFHFLTDPVDRERYVQALRLALRPGGQAIIAAFALDGPERCSGLEIVRYDADGMGAILGDAFRLLEERRETHMTPLGREQRFGFFRFKYSVAH